ncbi:MAG: hypothetical protein ACP5GU_09890 [Thermoprotei archaeon]
MREKLENIRRELEEKAKRLDYEIKKTKTLLELIEKTLNEYKTKNEHTHIKGQKRARKGLRGRQHHTHNT